MMNFIDIFNKVARAARPAFSDLKQAENMDEKFEDLGLDSLDGLVMSLYFGELYGIADDDMKEWKPTTIQEMHDLIMASKTKEPQSMDEVEAVIK